MDELIDFINNKGFEYGNWPLDGQIHRFDKGGKSNGWFVGHHVVVSGKDYYYACIGDWKIQDDKHTYKADKGLKGKPARIFKDRIKKINKKISNEIDKKQIDVGKQARDIFSSCPDTPTKMHPYLEKKGLYDYFGAKVLESENAILIPCKNHKSIVFGFQKIYPDGSKYFLKGQKKKGLFFRINHSGGEYENIYLCEGYSTAASITMATNCPSIVCFDAGNLVEVARVIKNEDLFRGKKLIVCGDNDQFNETNVGIDKAKKAASILQCGYSIPEFKNLDSKPTDFNDLYLLEGLTEVKEQVNNYELGEEQDIEDIKDTYVEFVRFFKKYLPTYRRDILTGNLYHLIEGDWQPVANYIPVLRSHAISEYLPKDQTGDHLDRFQSKIQKELLIDIPEWDGINRIDQILNKVTVANVEHRYFVELFKDWLGTAMNKIWNYKVQNNLICMIGRQGLGKDRLVDYMFTPLDTYYTNIDVKKEPDENFMIMRESIIINIPEFDQSKNIPVSVIKDMVTRTSSKFRDKYARAPQNNFFRCSFISTSNDAMILRDTTGNRRFVLFEVSNIDWDYEDIDQSQLLAEYKYLADSRFKASSDALDAMKKYVDINTPDDPLEAAVMDVINYLKVRSYPGPHDMNKELKVFKWADISDEVHRISKSYSFKAPKKILTQLKVKGYSWNKGGSAYYGLPESKPK